MCFRRFHGITETVQSSVPPRTDFWLSRFLALSLTNSVVFNKLLGFFHLKFFTHKIIPMAMRTQNRYSYKKIIFKYCVYVSKPILKSDLTYKGIHKMYLEYSASGTIETNNIYDNISLGKDIGVEYVRARAGLRITQFLRYSTKSQV